MKFRVYELTDSYVNFLVLLSLAHKISIRDTKATKINKEVII